MPKDGMSLATAPANGIYDDWVWEKGIHTVQTLDNKERCRPYAVGDPIWIKPQGSQCTTKFKLGWVTDVVSHHSVEVNGVPHHIKDLCPFLGLIPLFDSESDSDDLSKESGIPIALGPTPLNDAPDTRWSINRCKFIRGWRSCCPA